jgi:aminoglycoside phosphotransferase family enzyme/predicted kinase
VIGGGGTPLASSTGVPDAADSLPTDLARPAAFPPPCPARVSVATTHASWVFLTEGEAWKVKRPVDYGFLDFSTPEKRRRCCEDEVRLGARLAPDVYREVAPVYRGAEGASFVGPGEVVDHAVRMRRLPDGRSAQALLAAGRLGFPELERLAVRLAAFYADALCTPEMGAPAILAAHVAENQAQLRPWSGRFVDREAVETLYHWQQGQLLAHRRRLDERVVRGRIREGHGDLRLEHVYFLEAAAVPVVIDPIEFNRGFRCADAALDVSFLAMELEAAERPALAAAFLAAFARAANDYHFYPLLELYRSYRAEVRAKVACLVAGDPGTPPDKARRKGEDAARLLALALSYRDPPPGPGEVIAVGGPIGSGKSTLADLVGRALRLPVISSDATRKHLGGLRPDQRGGPELYSAAATARTYEEVVRRAQDVLDSGRGVVLDATFHTARTRALVRALAYDNRRRFLLAELTADEALLRERLQRREQESSLSDARESLLPAMIGEYARPSELRPGEHLALDARLAPELLCVRVCAAVDGS